MLIKELKYLITFLNKKELVPQRTFMIALQFINALLFYFQRTSILLIEVHYRFRLNIIFEKQLPIAPLIFLISNHLFAPAAPLILFPFIFELAAHNYFISDRSRNKDAHLETARQRETYSTFREPRLRLDDSIHNLFLIRRVPHFTKFAHFYQTSFCVGTSKTDPLKLI